MLTYKRPGREVTRIFQTVLRDTKSRRIKFRHANNSEFTRRNKAKRRRKRLTKKGFLTKIKCLSHSLRRPYYSK